MEEMQTIAEFAKKYNIILDACESWHDNPWMGGGTIPHASHYRCKLVRLDDGQKKVMEMYFSMGPAHKNKPTLEDLLNAISCDAGTFMSCEGDFREFCASLGYGINEDARETFKWCEHFTNLSSEFLGEELLHELIYDTEPL